jgi:hypothetical protein
LFNARSIEGVSTSAESLYPGVFAAGTRVALEGPMEDADMRDNRQRRRREDVSNDYPLRRHKDLLDLLQQDFVDPNLPIFVVVKERRVGEERRRTDRRQSISDRSHQTVPAADHSTPQGSLLPGDRPDDRQT